MLGKDSKLELWLRPIKDAVIYYLITQFIVFDFTNYCIHAIFNKSAATVATKSEYL